MKMQVREKMVTLPFSCHPNSPLFGGDLHKSNRPAPTHSRRNLSLEEEVADRRVDRAAAAAAAVFPSITISRIPRRGWRIEDIFSAATIGGWRGEVKEKLTVPPSSFLPSLTEDYK